MENRNWHRHEKLQMGKEHTMETLSRGIECSACNSKMAEYTVKDKDGKVIMYLCYACANVYAQNEYVKGDI
jgi:transcription elongation factor Elf1